jgi:hypothetical protein
MKADRELYDALVKAQIAKRLDDWQQMPIIILLSLASIIYLATVLIPWSIVSLVLDGLNIAVLLAVWVLMWRSWPKKGNHD